MALERHHSVEYTTVLPVCKITNCLHVKSQVIEQPGTLLLRVTYLNRRREYPALPYDLWPVRFPQCDPRTVAVYGCDPGHRARIQNLVDINLLNVHLLFIFNLQNTS